VFERFTQEARQVVVCAQMEARELRHNYIGTEHILLGFWSNTELGAGAALTALGLSADYVREQVTAIIGMGEEATTGQIPFTPRAKKVMELGLREAHSLGHSQIESLHLLLGLVRENEGVGMRVLHESGVSSEQIRETAIAMLPAGETAGTGQQLGAGQFVATIGATARGESAAGPGASFTFTVTPDKHLRAVLRAAAQRALGDGREQFGVEDLRAVLDEQPPSSEAASA
jgi:ATP-dependent Clp protease ATP-binding subunit ClpC